MSNPQGGLETRVANLEKQLALLQSVMKVAGPSVTINAADLRITAGKLRIDAAGGVDVEPMLRTSILCPKVIQGAAAIDVGKINGMRITKVPPFILPF